MLRWLYIQIIWAHPAVFRQRFGDEMLEAFDESHGRRERLALLLDGFVSLLRQWILRPEFRRPWEPASASGPVYELLTFQQIEPYKPRGIALAQGGVLAIFILLGVVNAINYGGGKVRTFLIGMHRPGHGLIRVDRASFEGGPLNTTVDNGRNADDPWRPFALSYFRIVRVLSALDSDGNLAISSVEMSNAPAALRGLDLNHDGKLSAEECGFLPPGNFDPKRHNIEAYRREFMRDNPVLAALDSDHDGQISAGEIANSTVALQSLDFNLDGNLTPNELMPYQALSRAAAMMTRFDTYDNGVISLQELPKDDADVESIRRMLTSADRNHDGMVTRGELIVELAGRTPAAVPKTVPPLRPLP